MQQRGAGTGVKRSQLAVGFVLMIPLIGLAVVLVLGVQVESLQVTSRIATFFISPLSLGLGTGEDFALHRTPGTAFSSTAGRTLNKCAGGDGYVGLLQRRIGELVNP